MAKQDFFSAKVELGHINALVKNIATQMGITDESEAVRRINSGEWIVAKRDPKLLFTTETGIAVYDHEDHFRFTLPASDGTTGKKWIGRLEKKGYRVSDYAKSILTSRDFRPTTGVTTEVVVLKGSMFEDNQRITANIRTTATERTLEKPNAETVPMIRENFTDKEIEAMGLTWIVAMHEPIKDSDGDPNLLNADRNDDGQWLGAYCDSPGLGWNRGSGFAFAVSQVSA
jgi:hypothetical protein